jgi:hypothetical protein
MSVVNIGRKQSAVAPPADCVRPTTPHDEPRSEINDAGP